MQKMLRKLIELLPISRRTHAKNIKNTLEVLAGLIEAEANHCQVEMSIIQQLQMNKIKKAGTKTTKNDVNDVSYS